MVDVELADGAIDGFAGGLLLGAEALEELVDDDLVAVAGTDCAKIFKGRAGQATVRGGHEAEGVRFRVDGSFSEDGGERGGGAGEGLAGSFDVEAGADADDLDVAGFEDAAILAGEDGDEYLVAKALLLGVPVDVEEGGVAASGAVFEDIPPEAVLAADGHVVGDDVEDLAEAVFAESFGEALVGQGAAELFVDAPMVDYIVAVHGVRRGLEVGGAIDVRDAEG